MKRAILTLVGMGAIFLLSLPLVGWAIEYCWNQTMPYLFGLKAISWWQGMCLSFLTSLLLKSSLTTTKGD